MIRKSDIERPPRVRTPAYLVPPSHSNMTLDSEVFDGFSPVVKWTRLDLYAPLGGWVLRYASAYRVTDSIVSLDD